MFDVYLENISGMTEKEKSDAELTYLTLRYYFDREKPFLETKEYQIRKSVLGYSFAESQIMSSYRILFDLSAILYARTGKRLIGFVSQEERTCDNALRAWKKIYRAIEDTQTAVLDNNLQ